MDNLNDPRPTGVNAATTVGVPSVTRDAGLRSYMLSVYNYMASGVLVTGIVALLFCPVLRACVQRRQTRTARWLSRACWAGSSPSRRCCS